MTVLGHHPSDRKLSDDLGARHFELMPMAWKRLDSRPRRRAENRHFRDRTLPRGNRIVLAASSHHARQGSSFSMELHYLLAKGKRPASTSRYVAWLAGSSLRGSKL